MILQIKNAHSNWDTLTVRLTIRSHTLARYQTLIHRYIVLICILFFNAYKQILGGIQNYFRLPIQTQLSFISLWFYT